MRKIKLLQRPSRARKGARRCKGLIDFQEKPRQNRGFSFFRGRMIDT